MSRFRVVPRFALVFLLLLGAAFGASACDERRSAEYTLRVWSHQGQEAESRALREIARTFNQAHAGRVRVDLGFFPDFQYTERLAIAAAAGDLPDAFDLDGPLVARFVDAALLAPLGAGFSPSELDDFLPSIIEQGTIDGRLYALGAFDSAAVLYYDRDLLERAGVKVPLERGFSWPELLAACQTLLAAGIEPLSLHMDQPADEWFTYAFSPLVWSNGGSLVSKDGKRVRGVLDSPENVQALANLQKLFRRGYASADPVDPDPFGHGKVAMDYAGHWLAREHLAQFGARLGVMPLPRVGEHTVSPCGSFAWTLSARSARPELALEWIRWVTDARHGIAPLVRANGAIPARRSAFALFPEYATDPYRLFRRLLETVAHPRPRTPFYATLTQEFAAVVRDVAHGADPQASLEHAANEVDRVIARRHEGTGAVR
jgi:ABC-type glycerol-3-phosphate transport system substrate-binding protein